MKTEEITREPRAAAHLVSRALQDLAPLHAEVLDGRGKRVPLSSAGYVLHAGRKYRLRIVPPPDADLLGLQVITPPDFLKVGHEVAGTDEHGPLFWLFPAFILVVLLFVSGYNFFQLQQRSAELLAAFQENSSPPPQEPLRG
jgi:hypothetical protein